MTDIFDDIERLCAGSARHGETQFGYLNRSGRIEAIRVRSLISDWLDHYPSIHRPALIARLRSPIDSAHFSAFFELMLHELLMISEHTIVEVEPKVSNSTNQPDFLVKSSNGELFYLEAVTAMGESTDDAAAQARIDDAVRIVDEASAEFHFLDLQIEGKPSQQVTLRKLRRALGQWVSALPKSEEIANIAPFIYTEHGMKLTVGAIARRKPAMKRGGAIGVHAREAYWSVPGGGIRESVQKKASKYGALDQPYVVAVNAMGSHHGEQDAIDAMFGSPSVTCRFYDDGHVEQFPSRSPDGVWIGDRGPRKRGLSAVLSTERISPWSVAQRRARLIRNPWAKQPLPHIPLDLDEHNPVDGQLTRSEGKSLSTIFGLPSGWPED